MSHISDGLEEVVQKLKKSDLKVTPQRVAILQELVSNREHPTADAVYQKIKQKIPNVSFDTVNRTLIAFAKNRVIKITEGQGGAKRYDSMMESHHHFHCVACNEIIDFVNKKYDKIKLPDMITKQNQVFSQRIVADGICWNCKNKRRQ